MSVREEVGGVDEGRGGVGKGVGEKGREGRVMASAVHI